VFLKRKIEIMK